MFYGIGIVLMWIFKVILCDENVVLLVGVYMDG